MRVCFKVGCAVAIIAHCIGLAVPAMARPVAGYGWRCDPYSINGRYVTLSCDKQPLGGPGTKFRTVGVCVSGTVSYGPWVLPGYTSTAYCYSYPYEAYMQHN